MAFPWSQIMCLLCTICFMVQIPSCADESGLNNVVCRPQRASSLTFNMSVKDCFCPWPWMHAFPLDRVIASSSHSLTWSPPFMSESNTIPLQKMWTFTGVPSPSAWLWTMTYYANAEWCCHWWTFPHATIHWKLSALWRNCRVSRPDIMQKHYLCVRKIFVHAHKGWPEDGH